MKTCFEISDLRSDLKELRTPLDNRTYDRKQLVKQVRAITIPYYLTNYGIYAYLQCRDIKHFNNNLRLLFN